MKSKHSQKQIKYNLLFHLHDMRTPFTGQNMPTTIVRSGIVRWDVDGTNTVGCLEDTQLVADNVEERRRRFPSERLWRQAAAKGNIHRFEGVKRGRRRFQLNLFPFPWRRIVLFYPPPIWIRFYSHSVSTVRHKTMAMTAERKRSSGSRSGGTLHHPH